MVHVFESAFADTFYAAADCCTFPSRLIQLVIMNQAAKLIAAHQINDEASQRLLARLVPRSALRAVSAQRAPPAYQHLLQSTTVATAPSSLHRSVARLHRTVHFVQMHSLQAYTRQMTSTSRQTTVSVIASSTALAPAASAAFCEPLFIKPAGASL